MTLAEQRLYAARVGICSACPRRQRVCRGPCPCTVDGRDAREHARAGDCPEGRYASVAVHRARPPEPVPDDYDPARHLEAYGCDCGQKGKR